MSEKAYLYILFIKKTFPRANHNFGWFGATFLKFVEDLGFIEFIIDIWQDIVYNFISLCLIIPLSS